MRRAVSFLTIFGSGSAPNESTLAWFPEVGALIGLALGGIWWLAAKVWSPIPTAAVVVVAELVITGMLHVDGLADAGDGLIAPLERHRRLEAMADPSIGAFGAITVSATLILRFAALTALRPAPLVLAGLWCASRTAMALIAITVPYARANGIVSNFLGSRVHGGHRRATLMVSVCSGFVLAAVLVFPGPRGHGLAALGAELAVIGGVVVLSIRRIGGFTGDVLGAAGVVGETVGLLVLATR